MIRQRIALAKWKEIEIISRAAQIRQIESKTLAKLRHPSRAQMFREYLD